MIDLDLIIGQFNIDGNVESIVPYGSGHINISYLVTTSKKRYILQSINYHVFKNVKCLMNNIELVTSYIKEHFKDKKTLTLIQTKTGESYYSSLDGYYRLYDFVEGTVCLEKVESKESFYECGKSFGEFAMMLSSFDASKLFDVLPNFHNTKIRYDNLMESIDKDTVSRKLLVTNEIEFCKKRKDFCKLIVDKLESGEIPLKVTHNDTKINNILLDEKTLEGKVIIDLDTVMKGSILYDFGDSIRFGCNTSTEDEINLDNVHFDVNLFEAFTKGYLEALKDDITFIEKNNLVNGAIMMTLECGMRFLTDYLDGDVYFNTSRENHNLDRCRTQFKLVKEMEERKEELENIVDKYYQICSL